MNIDWAKINWNAVSAIGQVLSAIFALVAVIAAIIIANKQNKPRVVIKSKISSITWRKISKDSVISVYVSNIGMIPIQIDIVGIEFPERYSESFELKIDQLPVILLPGQVFKSDYKFEKEVRTKKGEAFLGDVRMYAIDGLGNIYKERRSFLLEVSYPIKKHYNQKFYKV